MDMQRMRGFTLIELMLTIIVLAILVALAAPSFRTMILNQQSEAIGEDLITAFQVARSEAIRQGGFVTVCPTDDGANCGGSWGNGLMVVVDSAAATGAAINLASQDDRIRYTQIANDNAVISTTGPGFVRYDGRGLMVNSEDPFTLTSHVTDCVGERQRVISIGRAGMISMRRNDCPEAS